MFTIKKEFKFEAAHSLPTLPSGHKCRNLHGHSYRMIAEFSGDLDEHGFVVDLDEVKAAVDPLIELVDHKNLNAILPYPTSSEMLAKWFYDKISKCITTCVAVTIKETATISATYRPPTENE